MLYGEYTDREITHRETKIKEMFTGEFLEKFCNVDCSLSCDNSNMFTYTNFSKLSIVI